MTLTKSNTRRGSTVEWHELNPILAEGDMGISMDTRQFKIGDGVTKWRELPFALTLDTNGNPVDTRSEIEALLYDKAYSWELQPGSDIMATCIGVLPLIEADVFHDGGTSIYAGLVTVEAGVVPPAGEPEPPTGTTPAWYLVPADTPLQGEPLADAALGYFAGQAHPAGIFVAVRYQTVAAPPPYAFPEGWTPGNTTGSGPVLPYLGDGDVSKSYHYAVWSGLVEVPAGNAPADGSGWYLYQPTTPLTWLAVDSGAGFIDSGSAIDAGVYLVEYIPQDNVGPAPTALPEGWTFRPYGIGPIAITDENAGGLIGDVAYVVSGYVYNDIHALSLKDQAEVWTLNTPDHSVSVNVGDAFFINVVSGYFTGPAGSIGPGTVSEKLTVTTAGTLTTAVVDNRLTVTASGGAVVTTASTNKYWPFIERYDLAAKKWLPRIPLPLVDETHPYSAEGHIAGVIDDKLYFGGGDSEDITGVEFFVYDPADDSFTRLADMDSGNYTDYCPYGVVNGKLVYLGGGNVWTYENDTWQSALIDGSVDGFNDQVAGFEIDGKLWFVYHSSAFVFDPIELTVTAKAAAPSTPDAIPFLIDGKIHEFRGADNGGAAVNKIYDPGTDAWLDRDDISIPIQTTAESEFVGLTYEDKPYLLSYIQPNLPSSQVQGVGVYGMTGVALDKSLPGSQAASLQTLQAKSDEDKKYSRSMKPFKVQLRLQNDYGFSVAVSNLNPPYAANLDVAFAAQLFAISGSTSVYLAFTEPLIYSDLAVRAYRFDTEGTLVESEIWSAADGELTSLYGGQVVLTGGSIGIDGQYYVALSGYLHRP